jgi:hypothetical protein
MLILLTFKHNANIDDGHEWSKMGSITEQNDLDDLMTVARLASKEFAAGMEIIFLQFHHV